LLPPEKLVIVIASEGWLLGGDRKLATEIPKLVKTVPKKMLLMVICFRVLLPAHWTAE
jgi:hypothetical protein